LPVSDTPVRQTAEAVALPVRGGVWLVVLLWFVVAVLPLGVMGWAVAWWSDDYWHNLRDATGASPPVTRSASWPFWSLGIDVRSTLRPLYYQIVPALTTWTWNTPWIAHALQAATHGAMLLALFRLMRTMRIASGPALIGVAAWAVYPGHYEAVHWFAAWPTQVSALLALVFLKVFVDAARRERWSWRSLGLLAFITATIVSLNEQAVAVLLVCPLAYAAAWPGRRQVPVHLGRALAPPLLCGMIVIAYVVLLRSSVSPGQRGDDASMVALSDAPRRVAYFGDVLWRRLTLRNWGHGAWELGAEAFRAAPIVMWSVLVAMAVALAAWVRGAMPRVVAAVRLGGRDEQSGAICKPWLCVLLGIVIFTTGWALVVPFANYEPDPRLRYWPCVGLAIALAALPQALGKLSRVGPPLLRRGVEVACVAGACVVTVACVPMAVMQVGAARGLAIRWELDQRQIVELREQLPEPADLTFLLPLQIQGRGVATGSPVLDWTYRSVFEFPWAMQRETPRMWADLHRRRDAAGEPRMVAHGGTFRHWTPREPVKGANESGIHYTWPLGPKFEPIAGGGWRIPWERAVPLVVDGQGRLWLVTTIIVPAGEGGGGEVRIEIPQARDLPTRDFRLPRA
jgi:hypothetical protein